MTTATEAQNKGLEAARAARKPRVSPFSMDTGSGDRRVAVLVGKLTKQTAVTNAEVDAGLAALAAKKDKAGAVKYPEAAAKPEVRAKVVEALTAAGKTPA